jgi:cytochrome c peroxidase
MKELFTLVVVLAAAAACRPDPIDPIAQYLNLPEAVFGYTPDDMPAHFAQANVLAADNTPLTNPVTDDGATLGRVLFYERNLSANRSTSCASCHHQNRGFGDSARFSRGFAGGHTDRHSMGLTNARFYANGAFFWDERAATLEDQVLMPVQDPTEMGLSIDTLLARLDALPYYAPLFEKAFGSADITELRVRHALAQFVRSMMSYGSRYDEGRAQVAAPAQPFPNFTAQENQGKALFFGAAPGGGPPAPGACVSCHGTEAFSAPGPRNNGLDAMTTDAGVGGVNGNAAQVGLFKVPSLRNLSERGPYMHDGRFATLEQVIDHYSTGVQNHPNLSPQLRGPDGQPVNPNFTAAQKASLVAFLHTLDDPGFALDLKFSDPFIR